MKEELDCTGARPADVLASIHTFLGRALVDGLKEKIAADGRGTRNLCLVGGCALNIKWNSDIRASGIADTVWVPPFPNDAGSALGAACCELLRSPGPVHLEWDTYAGPALVPSEPMPGWAVRPCSAAELAGLASTSRGTLWWCCTAGRSWGRGRSVTGASSRPHPTLA